MGDFEAFVPELREGARNLARDGESLTTAQASADGGVVAAAAAVSGGLVGALGEFASEWGERCGVMVTAIVAAGTAAEASADQYEADDRASATGMDLLGF